MTEQTSVLDSELYSRNDHQSIEINHRQFQINLIPPIPIQPQQEEVNDVTSPRSNPSPLRPTPLVMVVGQWEEKPGSISQGENIDDLLINMADAIQLMENQIGREPKGFWIKKSIKEDADVPRHSWQECVKILESAGYRLVSETDKHKKFRSPFRGSGVAVPKVIGTNLGGGIGEFQVVGSDLATLSFVIVPVQERLDERIVRFYKTLTGQ